MLAKRVVVWITTCLILGSAAPTVERSHSGGDQRIYVPGGRPVRSGEFPFLALLVIRAGFMMGLCSGSIPSRTTVLTAAHCDKRDIRAYAGLISTRKTKMRDANVQRRWVKSVAKYSHSDDDDIMVCYVNQPWVWTQFVAPVALCNESVGATSEVCQVMGFGLTEPYDMRGGVAHVMEQHIYNFSHCEDLIDSFRTTSRFLCSKDVGDKTICMGDSGGPAVYGGEQVGINVWLLPFNREQEELVCIPEEGANVYMDVSYYREWLDRMIVLSSAESIHRCSMKISTYEVPLHPPLWLLLLMTVELLSLH